MRSILVLAMFLTVFVSLSLHYSFWTAFGAMQLGGMLAVTLLAFTSPSK